MRREGYELAVFPPESNSQRRKWEKQEPFEQVTIDIEEQHQGAVMEALGIRKGEVKDTFQMAKDVHV